MLAAAPGSSRCSGSGSFPAIARGCRPPALVDRVSRCFVVSLEVVSWVSLEVVDVWLPPQRRQTCLRTPAARRAHVHLRAERRRELVRRRLRAGRLRETSFDRRVAVTASSPRRLLRTPPCYREVEPLGARDQRLARARAGPQEVEVRGDAPPRRRVHDLDGDAVAPAAAVCYVFLEDLRLYPARAPSPRPRCCWLSVAATPKNKTPPRTAECTWATQPVPTGAASTSSTSRQSGPSDASRARSVSRHACAGARSCKWAKRSQNARGKRSSRDEAHCASLTAVGPAARVAQRQ